MKTKAPSSMKRFAAARPMPVAPPVITAVFPFSLFMLIVLMLNVHGPEPHPCGVRSSIAFSPFGIALDLRHAPIDGEIYSSYVGTFFGGKERDCGRNFLGHASAAHWDLRGELCDRLLGLFSGK